jgi:hypothetical protein
VTLPAPAFYATAADWNRPVPVVAQFVLDTIVGKFQELSQHVEPLPDRRVITVGSVSVDAPILAVMYGGTSIGLPGNNAQQPANGDALRTVTFNVELWRATQTSSAGGLLPAEASVITSHAFTTMQDSWALLEAAGACDPRQAGVVASVDVFEPQGDMQGISMLLQVAIP